MGLRLSLALRHATRVHPISIRTAALEKQEGRRRAGATLHTLLAELLLLTSARRSKTAKLTRHHILSDRLLLPA
jgi:hypothetical protein